MVELTEEQIKQLIEDALKEKVAGYAAQLSNQYGEALKANSEAAARQIKESFLKELTQINSGDVKCDVEMLARIKLIEEMPLNRFSELLGTATVKDLQQKIISGEIRTAIEQELPNVVPGYLQAAMPEAIKGAGREIASQVKRSIREDPTIVEDHIAPAAAMFFDKSEGITRPDEYYEQSPKEIANEVFERKAKQRKEAEDRKETIRTRNRIAAIVGIGLALIVSTQSIKTSYESSRSIPVKISKTSIEAQQRANEVKGELEDYMIEIEAWKKEFAENKTIEEIARNNRISKLEGDLTGLTIEVNGKTNQSNIDESYNALVRFMQENYPTPEQVQARVDAGYSNAVNKSIAELRKVVDEELKSRWDRLDKTASQKNIDDIYNVINNQVMPKIQEYLTVAQGSQTIGNSNSAKLDKLTDICTQISEEYKAIKDRLDKPVEKPEDAVENQTEP